MMRNTIKAVLAAALLASSGCVSEVDEAADCFDVCEHFDDCVGGGFDASGCTDICEDNSDFYVGFEEQVDSCEECLEVAACSPNCNDVCAGIIPAF